MTTNLLALLLLSVTAAFALFPPQAHSAEHAVIAQYHHVSEDGPASTSLSPAQFAQHMQYLHDNGFSVMPLPELISALKRRQDLPDRAISITFDDGYLSIFDEAFPLLQKLGLPFTVFINTQPIDDSQQGFMTWDQIREMSQAGVTIANHMVNHPYMLERVAGESETDWMHRLRQEVITAETRIREETGQSHKLLAYPYGEYDPEIQQMLKVMDYVALAQHSGAVGYHSDFLALPRFPFSGIYSNFETYKTKVESLSFEVLRQDPRSPVTRDPSPAVTLQFANKGFRMEQLACYAGGDPLALQWLDQTSGLFRLDPTHSFNGRRWRYNCTAPDRQSNRFYWYSKAWVRPD